MSHLLDVSSMSVIFAKSISVVYSFYYINFFSVINSMYLSVFSGISLLLLLSVLSSLAIWFYSFFPSLAQFWWLIIYLLWPNHLFPELLYICFLQVKKKLLWFFLKKIMHIGLEILFSHMMIISSGEYSSHAFFSLFIYTNLYKPCTGCFWLLLTSELFLDQRLIGYSFWRLSEFFPG